MGYKSMSVQMTPEHFDRSIKGSPKEAIKELIWNACDADAKNIEVKFEYGSIQGVEENRMWLDNSLLQRETI